MGAGGVACYGRPGHGVKPLGVGPQLRCSTSRRAMTHITINAPYWRIICEHLLPQSVEKEQAAFLFGSYTTDDNSIHIVQYRLMSNKDFAAQEIDYLELRDAARACLIKHAHDLGACLIEIHSHPGKLPATFSTSDLIGLRETVPHMFWRLPDRPYVALVLADHTFDALIWVDDAAQPLGLTALKVGRRTLTPTNLSLRRWT
jgi:Prokaryotic homologs of the JAB domain